jgi:hypothetical protein
MTPACTVSVVIEWDNVRLSELDRARRMLAALAGQAAEVRTAPEWASPAEATFLAGVALPVEALVTFDSTEFTEEELRRVVETCLPLDRAGITLQFVPVPGGRYYALKNAGATRSAGDLVVFLDSDAVPEPGWLQGLLAGFADADRKVIGGNTYLEPEGTYGKTFALTWFFPRRSPDGPLEPAQYFLANNVAFRRATFLPAGFDLEEGLSKGACRRLGRRLLGTGVQIYRAPRARCGHPPPNGARHFVERAIAQGRDNALSPTGKAVTLGGSVRRLLRNQRTAAVQLLRHRREVGLGAAEVPVGLTIAWIYYSLYFAGEAMSHAAPSWMRRHFQL